MNENEFCTIWTSKDDIIATCVCVYFSISMIFLWMEVDNIFNLKSLKLNACIAGKPSQQLTMLGCRF